MKGLTLSSLRSHPSLIPLFACLGAGSAGAALYVMRLLTRAPDVSVNRKTNQYPWRSKDETYQYKFLAIHQDYNKLKPAPVRINAKDEVIVTPTQ